MTNLTLTDPDIMGSGQVGGLAGVNQGNDPGKSKDTLTNKRVGLLIGNRTGTAPG